MSIRGVLYTAGVTMLTMYVLNFAASRSPTVRRLVKGSSVASVSQTIAV